MRLYRFYFRKDNGGDLYGEYFVESNRWGQGPLMAGHMLPLLVCQGSRIEAFASQEGPTLRFWNTVLQDVRPAVLPPGVSPPGRQDGQFCLCLRGPDEL